MEVNERLSLSQANHHHRHYHLRLQHFQLNPWRPIRLLQRRLSSHFLIFTHYFTSFLFFLYLPRVLSSASLLCVVRGRRRNTVRVMCWTSHRRLSSGCSWRRSTLCSRSIPKTTKTAVTTKERKRGREEVMIRIVFGGNDASIVRSTSRTLQEEVKSLVSFHTFLSLLLLSFLPYVHSSETLRDSSVRNHCKAQRRWY